MLLYELLSGLNYRLLGISEKTEITRPFSDSRRVEPGGLFICLHGQKDDGDRYCSDALKNGAVAILTDGEKKDLPCVIVKDTRYAQSVIWNNFYGRPGRGMRLYGITGTNGKTSTAAFLSSCLRADGRRVGTIGTLGAFALSERIRCGGCEKADAAAAMTTPDPEYLFSALASFRDMGITDTVMEVSSHGIMQRRVDSLQFNVGIFTNLTPEHLDFHKTLEEYFRVKASFIARCEKRIVNCDDAEGRRFSAAIPSISVGKRDGESISVKSDGVSYVLNYKGRKINVVSSIGGEFTFYNTLTAAVAALESGASPEAVSRGISDVEYVAGRLERVVKAEERGFDLFIDYAHTPAALEAVLLHLRKTGKGRLICVFGCGGDRDREKRPVMGRIAERLCDGVIVTGDNPRTEEPLLIIRDIIEGMTGDNSVVIPDRREAIFAAVSMAGKGDCVLLCGKGHETYEIVGTKKRHFDEREVVKEALFIKYGK